MASSATLKASGLFLSPNQLATPEGSLVDATNVIIRRDNVIEKRRGYALYGNSLGATTDRAKQLMTYQNVLIRHYNDVLDYDTPTGTGQFTQFTGSYLEPQPGIRIKSIAANDNLYFTTADGIQKISSINSNFTPNIITKAGGVKAIDISAQYKYEFGQTTGFLPVNSTVAYRVVWGTKDANSNLILGSPSSRAEVYVPGEEILVQDLNNVLQALDNAATTPGSQLLNEIDYVNSLKLPITATASQIKINLVGLADKIDNDILYADQVAVAPLTISTASISSNIATINFSSGDPTQYLQIGSPIFLSGFTLVNNVRTFNSTTDVTPATNRITVTTNGYQQNDTVIFSGTVPGGISSGTTYYVVNPTINDFQVSTVPDGSPVAITTAVGIATIIATQRGTDINNTGQIVTALTSNSLSFAINALADISISNATITDYTYRSITVPADPSVPATGQDISNLQAYLQSIIQKLQLEPITNISQSNLDNYILPLAITTTVTVLVTVNIPDDVVSAGLNKYFFQIYRSSPLTATGTSVLSDLIASDEMRQVYENFPTQAELTARQAIVEDIVPDSFAGAFLYTNEQSGEGILQANEPPPLALDINKFKNVVFYANTRTKQSQQIAILGVPGLISEYNAGRTPKLIISNGLTTNTYIFVLGVNEHTRFKFGNFGTPVLSGFSSSGTSTYFTINSGNDETQYYVWYQLGTSTDPAIAGKVGVRVDLLNTDTNVDVASKTRDVLSLIPRDFNVFSYFQSIVQNTTTIDTTGNIININSHGFQENEPVTVSSTLTLPSGLSSSTQYYIFNANTNDFQLATSPGGPAIALVDVGVGTITITSSNRVDTINVAEGPATDATTGTLPAGYTLSIIEQGNGQNLTTDPIQVLLSNNISPAVALDNTARSLVRVINANPSSFVNAFYLSSGSTVPGQILFQAKDLNSPAFYFITNNETVGSAFNPNLSPTNFITNITATNPTVITSANHGLANGDQVIITNTDSTPVIDGIYTVVLDTGDPTNKFSINVNVTVAGTTGAFSLLSQAEGSQNEAKINRVYYSKLQQPESVPIVNFFDVGASDKAILRIFPLRDSLFVFKEDGLYRISGENIPFSLSLFDSSCITTAPDSVNVCGNLVYTWTIQGIQAVSEAGVSSPISRPIDTVILPTGSKNFPNFSTATFGVGYESDNSYLVWTVKHPADEVATICYRYCNLTNTWTTYDKSNTCGIIKLLDDKLYLGAGDTNFIEQERKTFSRLDYADRNFDVNLNLNKYFNDILILDNVSNIEPGDVLVQSQTVTVYIFNMLLKKLDTDPGVPSSNYFSTLEALPGDDLRTSLVALATKLDLDGLQFTNYASSIGQKLGSIVSHTQANPTVINSPSHGLITDRYIIISGNSSTPSLNGEWQVTVLDANHFSIPVNSIATSSTGTWITPVEQFNDLESCYNIIIDLLNSDNVVAFSNYALITNETVQEAVVVSINKVTKQVTVNLTLNYIVGPITVYKSINSTFTSAPITLGDPLSWKQIYEATIMFDNKAFTSGILSFSTDLLPLFNDVPFNADSNGIFGFKKNFGDGFFGGASHSAPFRTIVPRVAQRCRYINVKFTHDIARENVVVYGITLTGNMGISTRAYRE